MFLCEEESLTEVQEAPSSLLPPHFGLLDGPEVRVVDHVVVVGFGGRDAAAGGQHGVLFVGAGVVLVTVKERRTWMSEEILERSR